MPNKSLSRSGLLTYQKYSSLLAGNNPYIPFTSDYELLETEILTGTQSSVTFSSLNSTYGADYQHLQARCVWSGGGVVSSLRIELNGDTGSNYSLHVLYGNGSSVLSAAAAPSSIWALGDSVTTTNAFAASVVDILDPFETTKYTTGRILHGRAGSSNSIELLSGNWRNTAAVDTINFRVDGGQTLIAGTRLSLYGLKASA
jgi:hypothetical protein